VDQQCAGPCCGALDLEEDEMLDGLYNEVGRFRLPVSKTVLKASMVSALEAIKR